MHTKKRPLRVIKGGLEADKEREYKRLHPAVQIRHAYATPNVEAEEVRVLNSLRLVGGTEVNGPGRKTFDIPVGDAINLVGASCETRRRRAVRAIFSFDVGQGVTVLNLVEEFRINMTAPANRQQELDYMLRNGTIDDLLLSMGISIITAGEEQGLDVSAYATVFKPARLLRYLPKLKEYDDILAGLALA
ncbi:hypothetical protein hmeg3_12955 [Herbaspirillum sp. meg3]|uniref:hypothetical protein n=1 Tax=Herbaspirillum sp. meg3 TaxID=2025949 RepID=UPI000B97D8CE|nr:hypothetical protein [Herbaspirillum sp. meg3]ASU39104.1 hypothetical protein hmeg3_12955 [Herbaspirillum sp. meg3]